MDDSEKDQEAEEELLNLNLSLVSPSYGSPESIRNTRRKKNSNHDSSTSLGSSDGGDHNDHHQVEILGLLQHREQMLIGKYNPSISVLQAVVDQQHGNKDPHLINLLFKIATFFDEYNLSSVVANLITVYQSASLTGDSTQRVAAYFADGLTAKLLKGKPSFMYDMIMKQPTLAEEFLAFTHLYKVSPCYQFSHFTANQAILEAFEREEGRNNWRLHVVDLDLAYGFQWPSLLQSLSERATTTNTLIYLRITGLARSLEELVETEARLVSFSKAFGNIIFEFQGMLRGSNLIHNLVKRRENETLAVNVVCCPHSSRNYTLKTCDMLKSIRSLQPSIVVLVQQGGVHNPSFPTKFMDYVHYYTAMFDSLDDCLPRDNLERLCIERDHLGKEMKNAIVNCFGDELEMSDKYESLQGCEQMMEDHGFYGIELSSRAVMQAKLLLRMRNQNPAWVESDCSGGFRVSESENGKALSLGWQDRLLITVSAWQSVGNNIPS